jgi:hypothetical protein
LCGPQEIACFEGGPPQWRKTLRKRRTDAPKQFAGQSDWEILMNILRDIPDENCADIAMKIRENLLRNGWIKEIELSQTTSGEELLRDLVNRRDVVPATMLLHSVLHGLARSPIENAQKMLNLCDFVGLSPDSEEYRRGALRALRAISNAINKKRYSRASMVVHQLLRQRGNRQCFPGFVHEAKPRAAVDFI